MFKVGDKVRIKDQDNSYCGAYGEITVIEHGSIDQMVTIERDGGFVAHAFMYQLEAA